MLDGLVDAFRRSANDPGSRGVVLDHTGSVFCAGVDLAERRQLRPGERNHSQALAGLYWAMWDYPKPVLCRVDGAGLGGGLGLVALADVVVATQRASFAFTEIRIGVAPALVGALAMARFGAGRLGPWLLSGESFGADVAREIGMVTETADDEGRLAIERWCAAIRRSAPGAQAFTKAMTKRFAGGDVFTLIDEMERVSADLFDSAEATEGMAAFAEKRPPTWTTA